MYSETSAHIIKGSEGWTDDFGFDSVVISKTEANKFFKNPCDIELIYIYWQDGL
jgi:hypothetical protein